MPLLSTLLSSQLASTVLRGLTGTVGAVLLAAALAFGLGYEMGSGSSERADLKNQLAIVRKDLSIANSAAELARNQQARTERRLEAARQAHDDIVQHPPRGRCPARADDVERLLRIR